MWVLPALAAEAKVSARVTCTEELSEASLCLLPSRLHCGHSGVCAASAWMSSHSQGFIAFGLHTLVPGPAQKAGPFRKACGSLQSSEEGRGTGLWLPGPGQSLASQAGMGGSPWEPRKGSERHSVALQGL